MLLLDLGNSYLKAQWWQDDSLQSSASVRIKTGWQVSFEQFSDNFDIDRCYVSSVPGSGIDDELQQSLCRFKTDLTIHRLSAQTHSRNLVNAYAEPSRLGVDRWLALLGAAESTKRDAIVIDAGSAITLDLLRADGQHLGGAILPGFNTPVARFKQMLSVADFNHPEITSIDLPGCSTESCIHINYEIDTTDYLSDLIRRWADLLADNVDLIVSGGDASRVVRCLDYDYRLIPDLVFRGMRRQLETLE